MKQWITLLAATAILCSCSKEALQEDSLQQNNTTATAALRSGQAGTFVSGWEQYNDWTKSDQGSVSVFTLSRRTAEITSNVTNGGLVLSYAKISSSDPLYSSFNQPKMLPFYYLPESERPFPQTFYFTDVATDGNITIAYRVPFTKAMMPTLGGGASLQGVQFQYVIFTKEFLDSQGLTAAAVRSNYTYDQVISLASQ